MKTFKSKNNTTLIRQSRWIKIHSEYITARHSLAEFADFAGSDDDKYGLLHYFYYKGRAYAIGQFLKLHYPIFFENEDGKTSYLCGVDMTDYSRTPLMIEIDDSGEGVRVFTEQYTDAA